MRRTTNSALVRRQRLAARIALYTSLVLVALAAWGLVRALDRPMRSRSSDRWSRIDYKNLPEVKLLQEYVRIDTTETTGSEVAGARFLARQLEAAGIPARIEILDDKHANVYALLEGTDPTRWSSTTTSTCRRWTPRSGSIPRSRPASRFPGSTAGASST